MLNFIYFESFTIFTILLFMAYLIKIIIAVAIIVAASELSKKNSSLAAILLGLPIVLFTSFTFIWEESKDINKISLLTQEELDIGGVISNPHYGMRVDAADYKGLDEWKIKKEVFNLKAKIGKYELIPLKELAIEINFAKFEPTTSEQPVSSKVHEPITVTERQPKNDQIYIPLLEEPRLEILGLIKLMLSLKIFELMLSFFARSLLIREKYYQIIFVVS